jgi:membrane-associated phospholipid phosphatase
MRGYRLIDYLTQGYLAVVALLILLFHGDELPHWPLFVAAHVAAIGAVHALVRLDSAYHIRVLHLLRCFYPMILYTFLYGETHRLDGLFYHGYLDGFFIDLDQRIFGAQPSRTMMQRLPYTWVSEAFYLFYFSYYIMVLTVGLALYFRGERKFWQYITVVSFIFYVCYLTYIFLPVMGPYSANDGLLLRGKIASVEPRIVPAPVTAGAFYKVMGKIYDVAEPGGGAAFPSSHVAVAVATLWFTWSYLRKARLPHFAAVVLLCLATVYCGYHYAVDVLGGLATAAVLAPLGMLIHRKWDAAGVA